ncbi:hypothetical protein SPBR_06242 [Sporothrix brasiliensis 5110]|uniref:phosphoserine phosphatase n=1 Tax=Sporothrix brasiliensis 5110 TaxID=1398154 RepID=A0A0C2J016_9PEZI|nr:uncharacterized protein SPBR_06242 [Sporothrix brasiliensis 5110]KIH94681.1 hypothetical protein SPBR_06242 [Sporothrix brasiliensis 5110]
MSSIMKVITWHGVYTPQALLQIGHIPEGLDLNWRLVIAISIGPYSHMSSRHEQLYRFESEWGVEIALQDDTPWRRHPRLVVFDMDSTLITQEVIDMLAETMPPDVAAKVADITDRAMQGELHFDDAFRERQRYSLICDLVST